MGNIIANLDKSHFYEVTCEPLINAVLRFRIRQELGSCKILQTRPVKKYSMFSNYIKLTISINF